MNRRSNSRQHTNRLARERDRRPQPLVGDYGMAVFRSVETEQLDDTFEAMTRSIGHIILRHRRDPNQRPMAISLLEMGEAKRQSPLGRVAIKEALDEIYCNVPSLRRSITLRPYNFGLIGRWNSNTLSVGILFDHEGSDQLRDEREEIKAVLETLGDSVADFDWYRSYRPHVSLATIPTSRKGELSDEIYHGMFQNLPEQIRAERATLFHPKPEWESLPHLHRDPHR